MKTIDEHIRKLNILNSRQQINAELIKEHETLLNFEFVNNLENPEKLYSSLHIKHDEINIKKFVGTLRNSINRSRFSRKFFLG